MIHLINIDNSNAQVWRLQEKGAKTLNGNKLQREKAKDKVELPMSNKLPVGEILKNNCASISTNMFEVPESST